MNNTPSVAESHLPSVGGLPSLSPLVDKVADAVVNISVKSKESLDLSGNPFFQDPMFRRFFNIPDNIQSQERVASGSGVIVDADKGYILTNFHVVDKATDITVTLRDRREFTAKLVGSDKDTDVALLQINADHLKSLPIGDSNNLRVGDYVVAVGNPFGLGHSITFGIVSALERSGLNIEGYEDFIQTDASINPGNSGGALINLKGELVGINTAIIAPGGGNVGVGFTVPSAMAQAAMDQLAKYGKVNRGHLGVQIQSVTPALAKNLGLERTGGALVTQVEKDSVAESAGLKAGDVIVGLNGIPVISPANLRNRIGLMSAGTNVDLSILRNGNKEEMRATIGKLSGENEKAVTAKHPALEGASFSDGKTNDGKRGVRVTYVAQDRTIACTKLVVGVSLTRGSARSIRSRWNINKLRFQVVHN